MVLGRKTNLFPRENKKKIETLCGQTPKRCFFFSFSLGKDGFGVKNQLFPSFGKENQLFPRENQKNQKQHLLRHYAARLRKDGFFGFFPRKKMVLDRKTNFFL